MKKKDILCAIDFSASSMDALKWAFDLAKVSQAKVIVMYCYRLIAAMDDEETLGLKRNFEEEAITKFKEFERSHLTNGQPVSYKFITEIGFYHFRIEMFLQKNSIGLLVMGNSTVQNFDEYKSVGFSKFLKDTKVPVVIVPQEIEEPIHI